MNKFFESALGKSVRRLALLAFSAALGAVVGELAKNPTAFGASTPVIYWLLRTGMDLLNPNVNNLPQ